MSVTQLTKTLASTDTEGTLNDKYRHRLICLSVLLNRCHVKFREQIFTASFSDLSIKENVNGMKLNIDLDTAVIRPSHVLLPFNPKLLKDGQEEYSEAVLVGSSCVQALVVWTDLAQEALQEIKIDVKEVRHTAKNSRFTVVFDDGDESFHAVYRINLKDGQSWALDITAAQHGSADILIPWSSYSTGQIREIEVERPFGHHAEHRFLAVFDKGSRLLHRWILCQLTYVQVKVNQFIQDYISHGGLDRLFAMSPHAADDHIATVAGQISELVRQAVERIQTRDISTIDWVFRHLMKLKPNAALPCDQLEAQLQSIANAREIGPPTPMASEMLKYLGVVS